MLFWAPRSGSWCCSCAPALFASGRPALSDWVVLAVAVATLPLAARSLRNTAPFILFRAGREPAAGDDFACRRWRGVRAEAAPAPARTSRGSTWRLLAGMSVPAAIVVGPFAATTEPRAGVRSPRARWRRRGVRGAALQPLRRRRPLIWFAPEKPVFVDGRQDPYPLPFLLEVIAVESAAAPYRPLFDRGAFAARSCPSTPTSRLSSVSKAGSADSRRQVDRPRGTAVAVIARAIVYDVS